MRTASRAAAAAFLAAAAAAIAAAPARAETLRLENGRVMQGTVDRGYVDGDYVRIQLFSTGGLVRVRWEHLIAEDRDRWQVDLGLKESAEALELKVDGQKIRFLNNSVVFGKIQNPDAMSGGPNAEVRVLVKGREQVFSRGQISSAEEMRLELEMVYTPRQAYELKRDEINPNSGQSHFDLAEYARSVGAYEESKEHYLKAKEDVDFVRTPQGRMLESKLATIEILVRNRTLQDDIRKVRVLLDEARSSQTEFTRAARAYLEARDSMYRLMLENTDKKIQAEFRMEEFAKRVETDRRTFFEKRMPSEVYRWLQKTAYDKSREQKVKDIPPGTDRMERAILEMKGTFEGARQYFTRQVKDDLWLHLLKTVGAEDILAELDKVAKEKPEKLTQADKDRATRLAGTHKQLLKDLQDFWANRSKSGGTTTSFGYGSFIVVKSDLKLTRKQPAAGGAGGRGGRGGNNQPQQPQAVDVIRTADQWWEDSGANDRKNWLLSWCAQKSGLLEIVREWDENCDSCGGLGYRKVNQASTGEEEAERCKVCNGAKVVHKVRWR
jgi:tetratricopeptide (TPR) repeat protein